MARGKNEVESLRDAVRSLKSEIRSLKKQLGVSHKRTRQLENVVDEQIDPSPQEEPIGPLKCPECVKGEVKLVDLGIRKFFNCTLCDYRRISGKG